MVWCVLVSHAFSLNSLDLIEGTDIIFRSYDNIPYFGEGDSYFYAKNIIDGNFTNFVSVFGWLLIQGGSFLNISNFFLIGLISPLFLFFSSILLFFLTRFLFDKDILAFFAGFLLLINQKLFANSYFGFVDNISVCLFFSILCLFLFLKLFKCKGIKNVLYTCGFIFSAILFVFVWKGWFIILLPFLISTCLLFVLDKFKRLRFKLCFSFITTCVILTVGVLIFPLIKLYLFSGFSSVISELKRVSFVEWLSHLGFFHPIISAILVGSVLCFFTIRFYKVFKESQVFYFNPEFFLMFLSLGFLLISFIFQRLIIFFVLFFIISLIFLLDFLSDYLSREYNIDHYYFIGSLVLFFAVFSVCQPPLFNIPRPFVEDIQVLGLDLLGKELTDQDIIFNLWDNGYVIAFFTNSGYEVVSFHGRYGTDTARFLDSLISSDVNVLKDFLFNQYPGDRVFLVLFSSDLSKFLDLLNNPIVMEDIEYFDFDNSSNWLFHGMDTVTLISQNSLLPKFFVQPSVFNESDGVNLWFFGDGLFDDLLIWEFYNE